MKSESDTNKIIIFSVVLFVVGSVLFFIGEVIFYLVGGIILLVAIILLCLLGFYANERVERREKISELTKKGSSLIDLKKFKEAIETFNASLRLLKAEGRFDQDFIIALGSKGFAFLEMKEYEKAIEMFDEILRRDPNETVEEDALRLKGLAYHKMGERQKADEIYDEFLRRDPNDFNTYYNKSCIQSIRNNIEKALQYLEKSIELAPDDETIREIREQAKKDEDFNNIKNTKEFKKLILDEKEILDYLKKKFIDGEITEEEYRRKKEVLEE